MDAGAVQSVSAGDAVFEARKQKVVALVKQRKDFFLLAVIIAIGAYIRSQNLKFLVDITTGKYISLELDSTIFLRYAQYIAEHGRLFAVDMMRNYPLGAEISFGVFTSYFVAYLYKFLHVFMPSITVEFVDVIYPIIATAVMTVFLFLTVRCLFDWRIAVLAAAFVNVMPAFLFRSLGGSSDHDILGMMFFFMTLYCYVAGWQVAKRRYAVGLGVLAGVFASVGISSAGLVAFATLIIGVFSLIEMFLNKFQEKDFYLLLAFTATFTVLWGVIVQTPYNILFGSLSTGTIYFAAICALVYTYASKPFFKKIVSRIPYFEKVPLGIQAFMLALVLTVVFSTVVFGPSFIVNKIGQIVDEVFKTATRFTVNRWIITVAENKRPYVTDWLGQYGTLFVYAFLAGSVLLFYDMVRGFPKAAYLTLLYVFFLIGYVFSRYAPDSVFNGDTGEAKWLFNGASVLFFGSIMVLYLYTYYKSHATYEKVKTIEKKYVFVFVWFFLQVLAATSAIRLLFEFSPIIAILAAFLFVTLYDFAMGLKDRPVRWAAVAILALLVFSPFSTAEGLWVHDYRVSFSQASGSGPGYTQQWQYAGKWVRENTPKDAVFAHWWDYGYWVQSGFERPTITDGGNLLAWWNYLMGRHVLTAQNDTEPLKFLYGHNASYLLMVQDEIGKYGAYSSIGADLAYDRFSYIPTFGLNQQATQKRRNQTVLVYQGGFAIDEDMMIDGKVFPKNQAGVGAVFVPLETENGGDNLVGARVLQPVASVVYQNQRVDLPFQCVYVNNQLYEFPDYKLGGCLRIIPTVSGNEMNPFGASLFLSRKTYASLFAQLYLFDKKSDYFTLVHDDSQNVPLLVYNGMMIGPIRIWKISYPKGFALTPEEQKYYVGTGYADPRLTQI